MRLIALNGFAYSIAKWLAPEVETPFRFNWTERNTDRLSRSITTPTILVGFSDGATSAMRIACTNPNIREAYIHSPEAYRGDIDRLPRITQFFRTDGDRTPTYDGTRYNYSRALKRGVKGGGRVLFSTLPFVPFSRPSLVERWILTRQRHIFHNCIDMIPPELTKRLSSIGGE